VDREGVGRARAKEVRSLDESDRPRKPPERVAVRKFKILIEKKFEKI
jgi:hypothetical protein